MTSELKRDILAIPTREERMGGQTFKYVKLHEVIDLLDTRAAAPAPAVKVKALEWEGDGYWHSGDSEGWMEEANTEFGWGYAIEFGHEGNFKVDSTFGWSKDGFETPDAAKAAAQADYGARIIAALEPVPAAVPPLDHPRVVALVEAGKLSFKMLRLCLERLTILEGAQDYQQHPQAALDEMAAALAALDTSQ